MFDVFYDYRKEILIIAGGIFSVLVIIILIRSQRTSKYEKINKIRNSLEKYRDRDNGSSSSRRGGKIL